MSRIICSLVLIIAGSGISAQNTDRFQFESSLATKISIGEPTRKTILYSPGITVNFPDRSIYSSLVYSLEAGFNYQIINHLSLGLSSGMCVVKFDQHPVTANEYYDRVMFPLVLKVGYQDKLGKGWFYNFDVAAGHQFADFNFANTSEGVLFKESGGVIGLISMGIGKTFGKYKPIFSIGYEINQFSHEDSLGWIEHLDYDDKIFYKTKYHFLRMSIGLKI